MRVKLLGGLGTILGKKLETRANSVGDLLAKLVGLGGVRFAKHIYGEDGPPELHRDLRVLVNGRSIAFLQGPETPLEEDDTVTLHLAGARGSPGG